MDLLRGNWYNGFCPLHSSVVAIYPGTRQQCSCHNTYEVINDDDDDEGSGPLMFQNVVAPLCLCLICVFAITEQKAFDAGSAH